MQFFLFWTIWFFYWIIWFLYWTIWFLYWTIWFLYWTIWFLWIQDSTHGSVYVQLVFLSLVRKWIYCVYICIWFISVSIQQCDILYHWWWASPQQVLYQPLLWCHHIVLTGTHPRYKLILCGRFPLSISRTSNTNYASAIKFPYDNYHNCKQF